jgi:GGDEF domain-containing protein
MRGDEFCVLLPQAGHEDCIEVARRIVDGFSRACSANSWAASLSIGAYSSAAGYELGKAIEEGDALMHKVKRGGKDAIASGIE